VKSRVLLIDDDKSICAWMRVQLAGVGIESVEAYSAEEGLRTLDDSFMMAFVDLHLPAMDGAACIAEILKQYPDLPCVAVSASEDVSEAIGAVKSGAADYLRKPLDVDEFMLVVERVRQTGRLSRENRLLRNALAGSERPVSWIGASTQSEQLVADLPKLAESKAPVLVLGETGTGKSFFSRLIHSAGSRREKPFVTVSSGTLPRDLVESELFGHDKGAFTGATKERPGRVELASGGTLYLDEIGDMPLSLQPKILRMLQEKEFERVGGNKTLHMNARIISSTNRHLSELCDSGEFREDLFYRLNVLPVIIPPLRDRKGDIEPIANRFLTELAEGEEPHKLSSEAVEAMMRHDWPGNVRELQNVLERAATFADGKVIEARDLLFVRQRAGIAAGFAGASLAGRPLSDIEEEAVKATLDLCDNNKAKAARILGISEKSIYNKLQRFDSKA
jgi:DNA-binding NtrC family response regulator